MYTHLSTFYRYSEGARASATLSFDQVKKKLKEKKIPHINKGSELNFIPSNFP